MDRSTFSKTRQKLAGLLIATSVLATGLPNQAEAQEGDSFKIGVITFLSGGAAESFGVPAWNGGEMLIEMLNEGGVLPAPYDKPGFGGIKIEPTVVDEAGGATKQVQEFRNLVQREKVDAVVGYVSSGDCLAIPPVADELKAFTILYDCGTPRVFEEGSYEYVFRAQRDLRKVLLCRRSVFERLKQLQKMRGHKRQGLQTRFFVPFRVFEFQALRGVR